MKNQNNLLQIEKAIIEKYGSDAVKDPRSSWSIDKEKKYLKDLKLFYEDSFKNKLLITAEDKKNRICGICEYYSFNKNDDVYLVKFNCCFRCYVGKIEGREDKWEELSAKN